MRRLSRQSDCETQCAQPMKRNPAGTFRHGRSLATRLYRGIVLLMALKHPVVNALWILLAAPLWGQDPRTEITKWQDDKAACVSLTYDDSSINQFRIDIPLLNERSMPGTFFIVTGDIHGSRNQPTFVGRPVMDIIRESAKIPTTKENALERTSMLNYLQIMQSVPALSDFSAPRLGRSLQRG